MKTARIISPGAAAWSSSSACGFAAQISGLGSAQAAQLLSQALPAPLPSVSTVSAILGRHNLLASGAPIAASSAPRRFEYPAPNELWQMAFKGHFAMRRGRCHPLTVLDDHSRFAVGLSACANEREVTARERLSAVFRCDGLPLRIRADNGPPFGTAGAEAHSSLEVRSMRLGVAAVMAVRVIRRPRAKTSASIAPFTFSASSRTDNLLKHHS